VAPAQLSSDEARKKADDVLAAYVAALGGRAALEKITSRSAKGSFEVTGIAMSGPVEMYAKAPNLMLLVLHMPGQEIFKDGFDGSVGWEQNPDDGVTDKTGLELGSATRDADFYQPLKLRLQYPNLVFKGTGKVSLGKGGTGKVEEAKLEKTLGEIMNLSPRGIREHLGLNKPIYARTSAFGHFGRAPDKDGGFSWEKTDLVDQLKAQF